MEILSTIYDNKAYYCILQKNLTYKIYSCDDHLVRERKYNFEEHFEEQNPLEEIISFYESIGLPAPSKKDFIPIEVSINKDLYVTLDDHDDCTYRINIKIKSKNTDYCLIDGLPYDEAISRATKIAELISKKID